MGWLDDMFGIGSGDPSNPYRNALSNVGASGAGFAGQQQGQLGTDTAALQSQRQYLMGLMSGQNSVSAEQLRQGLGQSLANQQSMAASASPQNAAMAARNAAMNMGRADYGMSGQQAIAGLQERNQAAQQLAQLNLGARGQDLQGIGIGYGAANTAYGTNLANPQKTWGGMLGGALGGLAGGLGAGLGGGIGRGIFGGGGGGGGGGGSMVGALGDYGAPGTSNFGQGFWGGFQGNNPYGWTPGAG
jgi:hypothetical protein